MSTWSSQVPHVYVCVCNGVTESEIRRAVAAGCDSMTELTMRTGCGACCGSCVGTACDMIADGSATGESAAVFTPMSNAA